MLLPGLALGVDEFDSLSKIEKAQQNNIRSSIAALAATIIPAPGSVLKRPRRRWRAAPTPMSAPTCASCARCTSAAGRVRWTCLSRFGRAVCGPAVRAR
ncbi:hypothetical protein LP420_35445 [Massilia sp. B-10]|nr:hypothetical protein LP420_35445 [Massilia sp. B-10]